MKRCLVFGEVLYDLYPTHKKIGGAPLNFGAHFAKLGGKSTLCSAVGADELGRELLSDVENIGVDTKLVSVSNNAPTAYCSVSYNGTEPIYTLPSDLSFDHIECPDELSEFDLVYFGSLAVRSQSSADALRALLSKVKDAVCFLDLNLRGSFYSESTVRELLIYSDIVKLNREEYAYCNKTLGINETDPAAFAKKLSELFGLRLVIITLDKDGSAVYESEGEKFVRAPIKTGPFVSAVGAGDSFSACFMYNYLSGADVGKCMEMASALASVVVAVEAAVPDCDYKQFVAK